MSLLTIGSNLRLYFNNHRKAKLMHFNGLIIYHSESPLSSSEQRVKDATAISPSRYQIHSLQSTEIYLKQMGGLLL